MPLLILRPLATAIIEYGLAFRVFRKGHFLPIATTLFLIALATYQFGEYFFLARGDRTWLAISLLATTMLPPYGLLLIEKLSHKQSFYLLFFIASSIFGLSYIFFPELVPGANECNCFAKFDSSTLSGWHLTFFRTWGWYYFLSLSFSMLLMGWHILKKHGDTKNLILLLIAYFSFFPFTYILVNVWHMDGGLISSVMCALAIIAAFIISHISVSKVPVLKQNRKKSLKTRAR